jgi:hypothetical protein
MYNFNVATELLTVDTRVLIKHRSKKVVRDKMKFKKLLGGANAPEPVKRD